jgi:hypothetical protein
LNTGQDSDIKVVELLKALGRAYLENGENHKALEKFRQVADAGDLDPDIIRDYAIAVASTGATDAEALSIYDRAADAAELDEALLKTLSRLFLEHKIQSPTAFKIYRQTLPFSPPFEHDMLSAIADLLKQNSENLPADEIRKILLDCSDHPELLSIYLSSAWRSGTFDDALVLLKNLYMRSNGRAIYLNAICKTLLEKKARAEDSNMIFNFTASDLQFCLKYHNIDAPLNRVKDAELYLDLRNLFTAYNKKAQDNFQDEYEVFLLEETKTKARNSSRNSFWGGI